MIWVQKIIDLLFIPFERLAPAWGMAFATLFLTIFALIVYKYTSNQRGIKKAKEKIKAHFLEVFLFIDDPILILKAQAQIMMNGLKYLGYALIPVVIMFLPVFLVLVNMEHRYHYRPFQAGESFLLKIKFKEQFPGWQNSIFIQPEEGVLLPLFPLRFLNQEQKGKIYPEIDYRVKLEKKGEYEIKLGVEGKENIRLKVFAEPSVRVRLAPIEGVGFSLNFWHPGTGVIGKGSRIHSLEITYPKQELNFFGWEAYWAWQFLVLMILFAFMLKPIIKVEF